MATKLFIVGKVTSSGWEFQGVFDTEQKAVENCVDFNYFVGPAILNEALPCETVEWKGGYYPKLQEEVS